MKKIMILVIMLFGVLTLTACDEQKNNEGRVTDNMDDKEEGDGMLELTIEELAMYDGKDGNKAYIAVNNKIYDVTGVAAWTGGTHNGNMAGTDVTFALEGAPHGDGVLDNLTIVGRIID